MKYNRIPLLFLLIPLFCLKVYAQDTLIVANNFKYKFGAKLIIDRSNDYNLTPTGLTVLSGGIQVVRKFGNSKSSIESGLYTITTAVYGLGYNETDALICNNLSIPVNYRFDTRLIYFAAGFYVDYLIDKHFKYDGYYSYPHISGNDRKVNFGFNLCLGIEKAINKQLSLIVEGRTFNNLTFSRTGRGDFGPGYSNNGVAVGINYKLLR